MFVTSRAPAAHAFGAMDNLAKQQARMRDNENQRVNGTADLHNVTLEQLAKRRKLEGPLPASSNPQFAPGLPVAPATRDGKTTKSKHAGKRCRHPGCEKFYRSGSRFCVSHGGGRRCDMDKCSKSAQGSTKYCSAHGGGRRCQFEGCNKGARGRSDFCISHGSQISRHVNSQAARYPTSDPYVTPGSLSHVPLKPTPFGSLNLNVAAAAAAAVSSRSFVPGFSPSSSLFASDKRSPLESFGSLLCSRQLSSMLCSNPTEAMLSGPSSPLSTSSLKTSLLGSRSSPSSPPGGSSAHSAPLMRLIEQQDAMRLHQGHPRFAPMDARRMAEAAAGAAGMRASVNQNELIRQFLASNRFSNHSS